MTPPLAPLFAQVREGFLVASFNGLTGEQQATAEAGYAALSSIERHVQDMETALGEIESKPYRAEEVIARFHHRRWRAVLPAREKGTE